MFSAKNLVYYSILLLLAGKISGSRSNIFLDGVNLVQERGWSKIRLSNFVDKNWKKICLI